MIVINITISFMDYVLQIDKISLLIYYSIIESFSEKNKANHIFFYLEKILQSKRDVEINQHLF